MSLLTKRSEAERSFIDAVNQAVRSRLQETGTTIYLSLDNEKLCEYLSMGYDVEKVTDLVMAGLNSNKSAA